MIWFFERNTDLIICEVRHASSGPSYEFEIAPNQGPPETQRFDSAADLLDEYLHKQSMLRAEGWRPTLGDIAVLS